MKQFFFLKNFSFSLKPIAGLFLIASMSLVFTQCSENDGIVDNRDVKTKITVRTCDEFSAYEAESIGDLHNIYLSDIMDEFDLLNPDWEEALEDAIEAVGQNESFSNQQIADCIDRMDDVFVISTFSANFDDYSTVSGYYNDILDVIDVNDDYGDIGSGLSAILNDAELNLDCYDLSFIRTCYAVAKNSAYFWTPTADNGEGNVFPGGAPVGLSKWWKAVIVGDLSGAAMGFMAYGVGLAVPGANAAIAGAIAFEAAGSIALAGAAASKP